MDFGQKNVRLPKSFDEKESWQRVIIILEHCPLQSIQSHTGGWELLSEKHRSYHAKKKQDPAEHRPDVVHQCLLQLLDSPLNRGGRLQIFLHTKQGVLISVDPRLRVPRSFRLFEKMMTQVLFRLKIRSEVGYHTLLKVVKNPVTDHLPAGTRIVAVEKGGHAVDPFDFCQQLAGQNTVPNYTGAAMSTASAKSKISPPFAFVVGGMSRGDVDVDYLTRSYEELLQTLGTPIPKSMLGKSTPCCVSFSQRGMSAASVCSILCHAFEEAWINNNSDLC